MIKSLEIYLITNGNGKEAVKFYENALDANVISIMYWKDQVPNCPKENEDLVLNAQLDVNGIRFMISDENPEYEYKAGTNMSATIITNDVETSNKIYEKLKVDAQKIYLELQETFWSPAYANLIDKFGMLWQISTQIEK